MNISQGDKRKINNYKSHTGVVTSLDESRFFVYVFFHVDQERAVGNVPDGHGRT